MLVCRSKGIAVSNEVKLSNIAASVLENLSALTLQKTAGVGLANALANKPFIEKTIGELTGAGASADSAIVICAGPSLHRRHTARQIVEAGYSGLVVATDGALAYCLREGLVPHYVISLDPHSSRIIRWFGDPDLATRAADDYFERQDLDPALRMDAHRVNRELTAIVDRHASRVAAVLSTSVDPAVTTRVQQAGMPIYWWSPIYDDYDDPGSVTRAVFEATGVPSMVSGGNCGTAAWVFAGAVLGVPTVALTGMDLSYYGDTPYAETQYFHELRDIFGERYTDAFIRIENPYQRTEWYTDPTYWWYRQSFLELAAKAPFKTVNCTEGGILFGEGIEWAALQAFLASSAGK